VRIEGMNPIRFFSFSRFLVITVLGLSCVICRAEEKSNATRGITIDFPGGPLSKLMADFNAQDAKYSIIQTGNLDPILPALSVRDENFDAIIMALHRILEPQGYALLPVSPKLAVLRASESKPPSHFASFQIERKLGAQSIDEFLSAIRAAGEFARPDQTSSTLRFKYHPGTKLLFVAGAPSEIDVVREVIVSLPETPPAPRSSTPENK
jgi:hypothetical protein